jgi:hypothetical protein
MFHSSSWHRTKFGCGQTALESAHRLILALDAAMILLDPVVEKAVDSMERAVTEFGPDRPWSLSCPSIVTRAGVTSVTVLAERKNAAAAAMAHVSLSVRSTNAPDVSDGPPCRGHRAISTRDNSPSHVLMPISPVPRVAARMRLSASDGKSPNAAPFHRSPRASADAISWKIVATTVSTSRPRICGVAAAISATNPWANRSRGDRLGRTLIEPSVALSLRCLNYDSDRR